MTPSSDLAHADVGHKNSEETVLLQGLPNAMCSGPCFEAMLEQAGLQHDVVSQSIRTGSICGEAVLKVVDRNAAARCIKHFHGRAWDPSGSLVCATIMAPPPGLQSATEIVVSRDRLSTKKVPSLIGAPTAHMLLPIPRRLAAEAAFAPPPGLGGFCATKDADTEESTDAGASDADDYQDEYIGEFCSIVS